MSLYNAKHIKKLREQAIKVGIRYLPDIALIEFDKAVRADIAKQKENE